MRVIRPTCESPTVHFLLHILSDTIHQAIEDMQAHLVNSSSGRLAPQTGQAPAAPFQRLQSRRAARRKHIQVTNCLRCAAQQLQQLIKVPQQSSNVGQQGNKTGSSIPCQQQQPQWRQQECLSEQAAWSQLALATPSWPSSTGPGESLPNSSSFDSSSSSSSSSPHNSAANSRRRGSIAAASGRGSPDATAADSSSAQLQPTQELPRQQQQQSDETFPDILAQSGHQHEQQQQQQQQEEEDTQVDSPGVRAALAALKWYKGFLSPSMASACRFLPTCSQYSMDSYRKYGVAKGTVLTAWRLLRCNPWGGSGYDPTNWPPVGLAPLFRLPYSAEVAVVVGTVVLVRFTHALLFE